MSKTRPIYPGRRRLRAIERPWTALERFVTRLSDLADYSALPIPQARWDSDRFARWLTTAIGVAVVPGTTFYGLPSYGERSVHFAFPKQLETLRAAGRRLEGMG